MRRVSRCSGERWSWQLCWLLPYGRDGAHGGTHCGASRIPGPLGCRAGASALGWDGAAAGAGGCRKELLGCAHSRVCSLGLGLLKSNIDLLSQLGVSQSLRAPSPCWQPCTVLVRHWAGEAPGWEQQHGSIWDTACGGQLRRAVTLLGAGEVAQAERNVPSAPQKQSLDSAGGGDLELHFLGMLGCSCDFFRTGNVGYTPSIAPHAMVLERPPARGHGGGGASTGTKHLTLS